MDVLSRPMMSRRVCPSMLAFAFGSGLNGGGRGNEGQWDRDRSSSVSCQGLQLRFSKNGQSERSARHLCRAVVVPKEHKIATRKLMVAQFLLSPQILVRLAEERGFAWSELRFS